MACRLRRAVDCRGRGGGRRGARGVRGACFASHLAVSVHYLKRTRIAPTVAFCALHLEAKALDAKLDAAEEAVDAQEREEGTRMRLEVLEAARKNRAAETDQRRQMAVQVRWSLYHAEKKREEEDKKRRAVAEVEARDRAQAREMRQQKDAAFRATAARKKSEVKAVRTRMQREKATLLAQRKEMAKKERANDHLVAERKEQVLKAKRLVRDQVAASRFAGLGKSKAMLLKQKTSSSLLLLNRAPNQPDPGI